MGEGKKRYGWAVGECMGLVGKCVGVWGEVKRDVGEMRRDSECGAPTHFPTSSPHILTFPYIFS